MPAIPGLYGSWSFSFFIHAIGNAQSNGLALLCSLALWVNCFQRGSKAVRDAVLAFLDIINHGACLSGFRDTLSA